MKLYGCHNTRSFRAVWALEECGAAYDYAFVNLFKGEGRKPEFLAVNPGGKLPVLVDGDFTLTESGAIVAYLADKFPESGLLPAVPTLRADVLRWMFFTVGELEQPSWTIAKHRFALPKEHRVAGIEPTAGWEFEAAARLVDRALGERACLVGDRFTAADIFVTHGLAWGASNRLPLPTPRLEAYLKANLARAAARRASAREKAAVEAAT
ncbi:MAG: glutathione S-transferase family protein [Burkholderiales bacterium]|jgi:glutathione S-transferase|nr:glutathione S-transferase family protein [Burkholderiales bacterium]